MTILSDFDAIIPQIMSGLDEKSTRISRQHQEMAEIAGQVKKIGQGVQGKIGSVLSALQIGDITRLRIEHIQNTLLLFDEYANSADRHVNVPIIMITSEGETSIKMKAIAAGATEFLKKPFDDCELLTRVRNLLALRRAQLALADRARALETEVEIAVDNLSRREEEMIWRRARAMAYYRDDDTGGHIDRVAQISRLLALGVGLSPSQARMIYLAAPLHDIGKIGICDAVLTKPGRLSPDEIVMMREHAGIGLRILEGSSSDLIRTAEAIAARHHEKWDGTGYPNGIAGAAFRLKPVADVLGPRCSERPYKAAWPIEKAYEEIVAGRGSHFDPVCVAAFIHQWPKIRVVVRRTKGVRTAAGSTDLERLRKTQIKGKEHVG